LDIHTEIWGPVRISRIKWEVETGGSRVQGQTRLHSQFEVSLGYIRKTLSQKAKQAGGMTQVVDHLPHKLKPLSAIPNTAKKKKKKKKAKE
jgi:hypothetical protein